MTNLEELIQKNQQSLTDLSSEILEYTIDIDRDISDVANIYVQMVDLKNELGIAIGAIEDLMNKLMAVSEILSVEDFGVAIEKIQGQSRVKWDNDTVRSVLAEKIIDQFIDPETGTLNVPPSRLIDEAFNVTGIRWKVTELKRLGINPDKYSEKKEGKISFRIANSAYNNFNKGTNNDDNEDFI